jgi:hypothetical protein
MKRKSSFRENKKVKIAKRGNWCGGGWTAGQAKDASDMTPADFNVPALSSQDQNCKAHDIALFEAETKEDVEKAHEEFYVNSADTFEGRVQSNLVYLFGPRNPNPKKPRRDHLSKSNKGHTSMGRYDSLDKKHLHRDDKKSSDSNLRGSQPLPNQPADPGMPRGGGQPAPAPHAPDVIPTDAPMTAQAVASSNKTNNKTHETAVDPVHDVIIKPFRRTQNVRLPYRSIASTDVTFADNAKSITFRLNAIYDIIHATNFVANPTPGVSLVDGTPNQTPMLYNYWKSFYQYYSVTSVDYRMKIWTNTKKNTILSVWTYHHGQQVPPFVNAGGKAVPDYMRRIHPQCHQNELHGHGEATTPEYNMNSKYITINGSHRPGQIDHEVAEDEYVETWSKFDAVPAQHEFVTFIFQENDRIPFVSGDTFNVQWEMEMFFNVQLKDLKSDHQYPTEVVALWPVAEMYKIRM